MKIIDKLRDKFTSIMAANSSRYDESDLFVNDLINLIINYDEYSHNVTHALGRCDEITIRTSENGVANLIRCLDDTSDCDGTSKVKYEVDK